MCIFDLRSTRLVSACRLTLRAPNPYLHLAPRNVTHILIAKLDALGVGVASDFVCVERTSSLQAVKRLHTFFDLGIDVFDVGVMTV